MQNKPDNIHPIFYGAPTATSLTDAAERERLEGGVYLKGTVMPAKERAHIIA